MRLLIVRHGESIANIHKDLGVKPGYEEMRDEIVPLTRWGYEQAVQTGRALRERYQHDPAYAGRSLRIIHSPYLRTRQTMQGILEGFGDAAKVESISMDARVREQEFGLFDCISDPAVAIAKWPEEYAAFRAARKVDKYNAKAPGGESRADVVERVKPFLQEVLAAEQEGVDVLIVGHGLLNRALEMQLGGHDADWLRRSLNPKNCTVRALEGSPETGFAVETISEGKQRPEHLPKEYKTEPYGSPAAGMQRAV